MANIVLLYSSYFFGSIHLFYIIYTNSNNILLNVNIFYGILTSIINHKITSEIAKWIDRSAMLIGIIIDVYIIESIDIDYIRYFSYYFLFLSILSFISSKYISNFTLHNNNYYSIKILETSFHITSHLLLTLSHLFILYYFQL